MYNGDPFTVSIRPRTTSSGEDADPAELVTVEMHELKHRGRHAHDAAQERDDTVLYDREVRDDDTIQSIALTHHVTVAELKRVNNLVSDQDFHALRSIKVPLKRHGILSEQLGTASTLAAASSSSHVREEAPARPWDVSPDGSLYGDLNDNYEADSDDSTETRALLIRTLSIGDSFRSGKQTKEAKKFLEKMDGDLEKIRSSTTSYKNNLAEVTATLTCKRISPISPSHASWNGADCGIRWWSALVCVIIVCLLVPSFYYWHYKNS